MMNIRRFKVFLFLGFLAVTVGLIARQQFSLPHSYETALIHTGKAIEAVYATAIVEPVTWAAIAPLKTGRILEVNVQEGDVVKAGDLLARLDDADLRAQLEEQKALAYYYESNLERSAQLLKKGYDSQEKYDARKADLAQTKARISMFEEQIRQLSLTAPMGGTILWRDVEPGEVKEGGEPVFWVGEPKPLRLNLEVDEEDIPKIKSGQSTLITADAFRGTVLTGQVQRISPKGDPVNKSYRVYASLPDDTPLLIGMTVETNTIIREKNDAILAPFDAVIDGASVWLAVEENGRITARRSNVETRVIGKNHIEIVSGLNDGDRVILPPFNGLSDGAEIRINNHAY